MGKWMLGGVFVLFGIFFTYAIINSARRQNDAARRFRPVEAYVVASRVARSSSGSGASRTTSYRPEITYRYTVDGREYTSRTYQFMGVGQGSQAAATGIVSRYPVGGKVTAYYDPRRPSVAILDPTPVDVTAIYIGAAVVWVVVGGLVGFFMLRGSRRRSGSNSPRTVRDASTSGNPYATLTDEDFTGNPRRPTPVGDR